MSDEVKLYRCMGGSRCNHALGTCTASPEYQEYQAMCRQPDPAPVDAVAWPPITPIMVMEQALSKIAGSHWERFGIDQTDIEMIPDLSAEEAMNTARDALSFDYAHPPAAPTDALVEKVARAICTATSDEPGFCGTDFDGHLECLQSCVACRNVARAALAAMQEAGE